MPAGTLEPGPESGYAPLRRRLLDDLPSKVGQSAGSPACQRPIESLTLVADDLVAVQDARLSAVFQAQRAVSCGRARVAATIIITTCMFSSCARLVTSESPGDLSSRTRVLHKFLAGTISPGSWWCG